ncbi:DUF2306 domain-containing protein [Deinococcus hopiensis]|uniref:PEP-CTERM protein-sorting domain-containing protein n=1 Tax=Deinococcus hopiensis KR-140 TaxID=695939 RepID=A0A1W1UWQ1_9DEIO|nr:DUF2306 domain-containing protein [Deinococcus hopiensis]SMB85512.1 PEP-CTERM protein-sorting domain-containing protein [Deinococcus hopiensis KR-140]
MSALHASVVGLHILGAVLALVTGGLALVYSNGSPAHRLVGKLYLLGWVLLAGLGYVIDAWTPGLSVFSGFNTLGLFLVGGAFYAVRHRQRIGRNWLRRHMLWMITSWVLAWIAMLVQMLPRFGVPATSSVFYLVIQLPATLGAFLMLRLLQRYTRSPAKSATS